MANSIDIINLALTRLGEQPINAIDEGSEAADVMSRVYDLSLESELRTWPWTWATTTASLAAIDSETPPDFAAVYQLPADYIKMVEIINPTTGAYYYRWEPFRRIFDRTSLEWEVREGKLYLDSATDSTGSTESTTIKYIKLQNDTTKWDSSFTDMFAWRLVAEAARTLTGRTDDVNSALSNYIRAQGIARGTNGAETRRATEMSRNYINVRS